MRIAFALPGFHRQERGAEVALLSVAGELARTGDDVTVFGSGPPRPSAAYRYRQVAAVDRTRFERFPKPPPFRSETAWEDATFASSLLRAYRPGDFDAVLTCNFPFTHWALRRPAFRSSPAPLQIYVTQNGDWPAYSDAAEFRFFRCDGLVCTNPDFEARNSDRWPTVLIPNGIDPARYAAVSPDRAAFGLPADRPVVLMVSAFIESKRVLEGMEAVAACPGVHFAVAGDGPLRDRVDALAGRILPGRFTALSLKAEQMPRLYASADCFLHLSLTESFGNVFVEAMASGLPVVGHDTPRLRWIVGDHETLCDTTDRAALHAAIGRALAIGRAGPDPRTERFGWPMIAERYRAFIDGLLDGRRRSREQ